MNFHDAARTRAAALAADPDTRHRLDAAMEAWEAAQEAERYARITRDHAIRAAIADGVTMYAIAKQIGMSEQGVRAVRDRPVTCDVPWCILADRDHTHG